MKIIIEVELSKPKKYHDTWKNMREVLSVKIDGKEVEESEERFDYVQNQWHIFKDDVHDLELILQ